MLLPWLPHADQLESEAKDRAIAQEKIERPIAAQTCVEIIDATVSKLKGVEIGIETHTNTRRRGEMYSGASAMEVLFETKAQAEFAEAKRLFDIVKKHVITLMEKTPRTSVMSKERIAKMKEITDNGISPLLLGDSLESMKTLRFMLTHLKDHLEALFIPITPDHDIPEPEDYRSPGAPEGYVPFYEQRKPRWVGTSAMMETDAESVEEISRRALPGQEWMIKDIRKFLGEENGHTIVARYNNDACGYLLYKFVETFHVHIPVIAVHPDQRRKRVAEQLMNNLMSRFSRSQRMYFTVATNGDADAKAFLTTQGFAASKADPSIYELYTPDINREYLGPSLQNNRVERHLRALEEEERARDKNDWKGDDEGGDSIHFD
jgi:ribosomal protein S18 acetylase RimI-like enzyme